MDNQRYEAAVSWVAREKQAYLAVEGWDDDVDIEECDDEEDRIAAIDAMQDDFYD
tara:strand:+ start:803 stop:967 length:165 start_codon:yes stop_codon:yes gene_type:complete